MNDIMSSAAFQEFLQKRCEEILTNDNEYSEINDHITRLESEINILASGELLNKIMEYERLNTNSVACCAALIYRSVLNDFKIIT